MAEKYAILRATVVSGVAARCDRELGFIVAMVGDCGGESRMYRTVDAGVLFLTMVILELLHIEQKVGVMWYKVSSLGTRETIK